MDFNTHMVIRDLDDLGVPWIRNLHMGLKGAHPIFEATQSPTRTCFEWFSLIISFLNPQKRSVESLESYKNWYMIHRSPNRGMTIAHLPFFWYVFSTFWRFFSMVVKSPGNQQPHIGLLLGLPQQHSDLLPGHHRWLHWRHVVLPQLQAARCGDCWWTVSGQGKQNVQKRPKRWRLEGSFFLDMG